MISFCEATSAKRVIIHIRLLQHRITDTASDTAINTGTQNVTTAVPPKTWHLRLVAEMGPRPTVEEQDRREEIPQRFEFHPTKPSEMVVLLLARAQESIGKYHLEIGKWGGLFGQA